VSWNPNIFNLQPFLSLGGILLTGIHLPDKRNLSFINSYGPCTGHMHFWEQVEAKGLLALNNLILAGDLNFSDSIEEVWGVVALPDPLAVFFKNLFSTNRLVDIKPVVILPTWCNDRKGKEEIQKET
jgi:hypothetical protein